MQRKTLLGLCLPCLLAGCPSNQTSEPPSSGKHIYIDPVSGEMTTPPKGVSQQEETTRAATSREIKPKSEPVPLPQGGEKVELNGRFDTEIRGSVTPDNSIRIQESIKE